jgi:hypothetical protein
VVELDEVPLRSQETLQPEFDLVERLAFPFCQLFAGRVGSVARCHAVWYVLTRNVSVGEFDRVVAPRRSFTIY